MDTCGKFGQNEAEFGFDTLEDRHGDLVTSDVIRVVRSLDVSGSHFGLTSGRATSTKVDVEDALQQLVGDEGDTELG